MPAMTMSSLPSMTSAAKPIVAITTEQTSAAATTFLEQVARHLPHRVETVVTDNTFAFTVRHALHCDWLTRFEQSCLGIVRHLMRPAGFSPTAKWSASVAPSRTNAWRSSAAGPSPIAIEPSTASSGSTITSGRAASQP